MKLTEKAKARLCLLLLLAMVALGQTLAFEDETADAKVKCNSATYVNDNPTICKKGNDHE